MQNPPLFRNSAGVPQRTIYTVFYLDPRLPETTAQLILQHGGKISPLLTSTCVHLMPFPPETALAEKLTHPVYSEDYVTESVSEGETLSLPLFRLHSSYKAPMKRHFYSYEEDLRMAEYVKAYEGQSVASLAFWRRAKEVLRSNHPPESLKCHYLNVTSKMKFDKTKKDPAETTSKPRAGEVLGTRDPHIRVTVWPNNTIQVPSLKREVPEIRGQSPPRKSVKGESTAESDMEQGFSQLSISQQREVLTDAREAGTLAQFERLAQKCREVAQSQLSEREVLRVLVLMRGDVGAVLNFYFR